MGTRLSRNDWLDHGLKILAADGAKALKAEPLARSLGVSRGSFYWHFKDTAHFHRVLLARYQLRTTEDAIADLDQVEEVSVRLTILLQRALSLKGRLERAVRSWATWDSDAAEAVDRVDAMRLDYVTRLLETAGVPEGQARARAIFIYWAFVGRTMMGEPSYDIADEDLAVLTRLLQS